VVVFDKYIGFLSLITSAMDGIDSRITFCDQLLIGNQSPADQ